MTPPRPFHTGSLVSRENIQQFFQQCWEGGAGVEQEERRQDRSRDESQNDQPPTTHSFSSKRNASNF